MKIIAISGTPGTGKSTLAKSLEKKLAYLRLDLHEHYKEISTGYDRSKQCYDIDMKKFLSLVKKKIKAIQQENKYQGLIIDSHISHLLSPKLIDLCIIMTCSNLKKLEQRLLKRKYSKKKVRENLDVEIFQSCLMEATEKKHKIIVFDTGKRTSQKKMIEEIIKKLHHK